LAPLHDASTIKDFRLLTNRSEESSNFFDGRIVSQVVQSKTDKHFPEIVVSQSLSHGGTFENEQPGCA
jgi:hypothetical protein